MFQVGDLVRRKDATDAAPCEVVEVKDLGHGSGNERVEIRLHGFFTRYYAAKELVLIVEVPE